MNGKLPKNFKINLLIVIIFSTAMYAGMPKFMFKPDYDLWFSSASISDSAEVSIFYRVRINILLWRGVDLSYKVGSSSALDVALYRKHKWLLDRFADYATEEERQYAVDFAVNTGDEAFINFVSQTFYPVAEQPETTKSKAGTTTSATTMPPLAVTCRVTPSA